MPASKVVNSASVLKLAIGLLVLAVPLQRLRGVFDTAGHYQSDIAFLPALFNDVNNGGSFWDWGLPEASYFLDWPMYFIAWLVSPTYQSGLAIFVLIQTALYVLAWIYLIKPITKDWLPITCIGLGFVVIASLTWQIPADYISTSFFRFSSIIVLCVALGIYLRLKDSSESKLLYIFLFLISVAVISDKLFIAWFSAPIMCIEALDWFKSRTLRSLRLALVVFIGTVFGYGIQYFFNPPSFYSKSPSIRGKRQTIKTFFNMLDGTGDAIPWSHVLVLACILLLAFETYRRRDQPHFMWLAKWFILAGFLSIVLETSINGYAWRYHLFVYFIPLTAVAFPIIRLLEYFRSRFGNTLFSSSLLVMTIPIFVLGALPVNAYFEDHTPDEFECLDETLAKTGYREGLGNYALARLVTVHSDYDLKVGSRDFRMNAESDVHSSDWAKDNASFLVTFDPNPYVNIHPLFTDPPEAALRALATSDFITTRCGPWKVVDFGPGGVDFNKLDKEPISILGCWLAEEPEAKPCDYIALPGPSRYVGFGTYFQVKPGNYEITAQITNTEVVGNLEVVLWDNEKEYAVYTQPLSSPRIALTVSTDDPRLSLEPRLLLGDESGLTLESITITKVS